MTTSRIDYSPDYKSEKRKPELIFVNDADLVMRHKRRVKLERNVIEAAKEEYKIEREADRGANTITRTDALIKLQPLMQKRRDAVAALIEFEQKHSIKQEGSA